MLAPRRERDRIIGIGNSIGPRAFLSIRPGHTAWASPAGRYAPLATRVPRTAILRGQLSPIDGIPPAWAGSPACPRLGRCTQQVGPSNQSAELGRTASSPEKYPSHRREVDLRNLQPEVCSLTLAKNTCRTGAILLGIMSLPRGRSAGPANPPPQLRWRLAPDSRSVGAFIPRSAEGSGQTPRQTSKRRLAKAGELTHHRLPTSIEQNERINAHRRTSQTLRFPTHLRTGPCKIRAFCN